MKKSAENRYPHSAELFRFCKEALNIKHNFEVKVIDQHVGAILGYDPADCSHWKKGKKNIKSLQTVNAIASHLEIDARFVTDIISGKSDLEESLQEFRGYGPFAISGRYHDEVKREFFRNPGKYQSIGESRSFEQVIDLYRDESLRVTRQILAAADVQSCPVMIPEIAPVLFPRLVFQEVSDSEPCLFDGRPCVATTLGTGADETTTIRCRRGEMKPHVRTLLAREVARAFLLGAGSNGTLGGFGTAGAAGKVGSISNPFPAASSHSATAANSSTGVSLSETDADELLCARINLFAGLLLIPGDLLQKAARQISPSRDVVGQLAEIFWVGRTVMNARLKDFFEHGN